MGYKFCFRLCFYLGRQNLELICLFSRRKVFCIRQEFLSIVFGKRVWSFCRLVRFQSKFKNVLVFFYTMYICINNLFGFDLVWSRSNLSKSMDSIKYFLVNFYHSFVLFSNLNCGTSVFREPVMVACVRVLRLQYP